MDASTWGSLIRLADLIRLRELATSLWHAAILPGGFFIGIYLLEVWQGEDRARYRSRHFANDMVYFLFFQGGFYSIFIGAAVVNAVGTRLSFLKFDLLAGLPLPLHYFVYWLVLDFIDYWIHRAKHASTFLWAFHAVHHGQEQMTFGTSWRFHPLEQMAANAVTTIPLLVLGVPTGMWMPLVAAQYAFEAVQHAQLNWRYGKLYPVFVSPVFHAIHHSTDRAHHDKNYAKILSLWDYLFGTAVDAPRPVTTGISGTPIPESLLAQLAAPFRILSSQRPREAVKAPSSTVTDSATTTP